MDMGTGEGALGEHNAEIATGRLVPTSEGGLWSETQQKKTEAWVKHRLQRGMPFLFGANMAITRRLFDLLGGFDEELVSKVDKDLGLRALSLGYNIVYTDRVVIAHRHPVTLRSYVRRGYWYAQGLCAFNKKHFGSWHRGPDFWRVVEAIFLVLGSAIGLVGLFASLPHVARIVTLFVGSSLLVMGFRRDVGMLILVVLRRASLASAALDFALHLGEKGGCLRYLFASAARPRKARSTP